MNDSRDSSIRHINVASLAISHLKQIIDKMDNFKEEDLQKLDNALATYMTKRRECTAEKLRRLPIEDTLLDQINSELLHTEK